MGHLKQKYVLWETFDPSLIYSERNSTFVYSKLVLFAVSIFTFRCTFIDDVWKSNREGKVHS